ncbi:efflux RND transporter periplasmic adaptor subunit [Desulfogranum mediterraneum]|uniref:efflux RND transporter periplasmic adaptor subunit n=1 Tax=Desulfogranum mediterraneum TaxID=160661 RepID=UPI0004180B74|nr:efflux RND transporter periplasmic adaptor subunit [Desulfogranum mediterraneum]
MTTDNRPSGQTASPPSSKLLYFLWKNMPRLALILFVVVIYLLFGAIGSKKAQLEAAKKEAHLEQKKLVNAVVLKVEPQAIEDAINLPGSIEAWTKLDLLAKVSGSITEVLVEEGQAVAEGEVLARIEMADYRIALDAARASYTLAKSEFERNQAMLKKKVIPSANLETSEMKYLKAKTELERARLQLSRCTITAPMASVVRRIDAKVGAYLSVGDPLAQLLQIDRVKAVVGIPESDVAAVSRVREVGLTIQALEDRELVGQAYFLSPSPETTAYLYRFELALDNRDHQILPGMFLRARIVKREIPDALMVPLYSIISHGDQQFVYLVEGDQVRRQPVVLGIISGWQIQVREGLKAGDRLVIEGHREVEEGQQVKIVKVVTDVKEQLL